MELKIQLLYILAVLKILQAAQPCPSKKWHYNSNDGDGACQIPIEMLDRDVDAAMQICWNKFNGDVETIRTIESHKDLIVTSAKIMCVKENKFDIMNIDMEGNPILEENITTTPAPSISV